MSEGADSARPDVPADAGPVGPVDEVPREAVRRIFRDTLVAAVVAVAVSAFLAPWRVTTGLALGGALAALNLHWVRTSVAAVFDAAAPGARPRMTVARYFLRYFVVAASVAAAVWLDIASLVATLAGMCAVVAALLAEGFRQFYFAIVNREET
jgi:hypothetical protein